MFSSLYNYFVGSNPKNADDENNIPDLVNEESPSKETENWCPPEDYQEWGHEDKVDWGSPDDANHFTLDELRESLEEYEPRDIKEWNEESNMGTESETSQEENKPFTNDELKNLAVLHYLNVDNIIKNRKDIEEKFSCLDEKKDELKFKIVEINSSIFTLFNTLELQNTLKIVSENNNDIFINNEDSNDTIYKINFFINLETDIILEQEKISKLLYDD